MKRKVINIYGGGAATLFLLSKLSNPQDFEINLFTNKSTIGRKFLVAGKGGFNLTNACDSQDLHLYYQPSSFLKKAFNSYDNKEFISYLKEIGIPTYIGSSNRVFPEKGIKPIQVLDAFKDTFPKTVKIYYNHIFNGFTPKGVLVKSNNLDKEYQADFYIFALGGASWSKTGSSGDWLQFFNTEGIRTFPFTSCNCGIELSKRYVEFCNQYQGNAIKNVHVNYNEYDIKGEFNITKYGLEGNAIYPLSMYISREQRKNNSSEKTFNIDFKPQWTKEKLIAKILEKTNESSFNISQILKSLNLSKPVIQFIKAGTDKSNWTIDNLPNLIKNYSVLYSKRRPIEEAISSSGGIDIAEFTENFELLKKPGYFCLGEMADWDTKTGGFLLQACYSMASVCASHLIMKAKNS